MYWSKLHLHWRKLATVRLAISVVKRDISSTSAQLLAPRSNQTMESAAAAVKKDTKNQSAHKMKRSHQKLNHLIHLRRKKLQKLDNPQRKNGRTLSATSVAFRATNNENALKTNQLQKAKLLSAKDVMEPDVNS